MRPSDLATPPASADRRHVLNLQVGHGWDALLELIEAQGNPDCTIALDPRHEAATFELLRGFLRKGGVDEDQVDDCASAFFATLAYFTHVGYCTAVVESENARQERIARGHRGRRRR